MTPKQQRFVECYCANGFNATQAAIEAGYSAKTAKEQGCRLLTNVHVAEAIDAHTSRLTERTEYTREKIAEMLGQAYEDAKHLEAPGAMVQASMGLAKLHGLIVDKQVATVDHRMVNEIPAESDDVDAWQQSQQGRQVGHA